MKTLSVSDLDGTLLNSQAKLSHYTQEAIDTVVNKGVCFSYATARSVNSVAMINSDISVSFPMIIYNGTFIVDTKTGKHLSENYFSNEDIAILFSHFEHFNRYPMSYSYINDHERVSYTNYYETKGITYYLDCRKNDKRLRHVSKENLNDGDVFYYTLIGPYDYLIDLYNAIKNDSHFTVYLQAEIYRDEYWLEIMPASVSKANAILKLKDILGCDRIISFGDALNDIPMFHISDECYAVSNAIPKLKESATAVIGSNDDDSVAKWLLSHATC